MSDDPRASIKLLIDEDLSPWVAQRLRETQYLDAVHVRDRARLGSTDREVLELAFSEDRIVVTANVSHFERLAKATELHAGIVVVLEGNLLRAEQLAVVTGVIDAIADERARGRDMVNRLLRVAADGTIDFLEYPGTE